MALHGALRGIHPALAASLLHAHHTQCLPLQDAVRTRKQLRATSQLAIGRLSKLALARAWSAWVDWAAQKQRMAEQLRRAVAAWRAGALRAAFVQWRSHAQVRLGRCLGCR